LSLALGQKQLATKPWMFPALRQIKAALLPSIGVRRRRKFPDIAEVQELLATLWKLN
jgi:hypothetical protein